jgi:hypothetical protein
MEVRKWLPLAIMLGLEAGYAAPFLLTYITNGEQDECTFGPVSNAQYRDYLRRAKVLSSQMPGGFSSNHSEASARFNELFENLVDEKPSVYERVAASHALLRSFGAQSKHQRHAPRPVRYRCKKGRCRRLSILRGYQPAWPLPSLFALYAAGTGHTDLTGPGDFYRGPVPSVAGDIRFNVNFPVFDTQLPFDRAPENCPPVPDQALSKRFSRTTR